MGTSDDGNVTGSLEDLKTVHEQLKKHEPSLGYTLTNCKQAQSLFHKEDVEIVEGHRIRGR